MMDITLTHDTGHLSERMNAEQLGPSAPTDLTIWLTLQVVGNQVLIPLLLITFLLAKTVTRHPTVISVCCTWIIAGISSCLLLYAGKHVGPEPSKGLCIAQTSLLNAVPPMCSVGVLALVYHTWSRFRPSHVFTKPPKKSDPRSEIALLLLPYLTFVVFVAVGLTLSLQHPQRVNRARRFFYCSLHWDPFTNAMAIFTAIVCLLAISLEAHLVYLLSRSWKALHRAGHATGIDRQLISRVFLFTLYLLCAMVVVSVAMFNPITAFPDMFSASIPLALFFIFASQPDVLRAWCFWRRPQPQLLQVRVLQKPSISDMPYTPDPFGRTPTESEKSLREYFESKVGHGLGAVTVIGRPEEAFVDVPRRPPVTRWEF